MQNWVLQLLEGIVNISNYKYPSCSQFPKRHSSYELLCLAVSFAPSNLLFGLVFQFSCCCLKLSTSQLLPGPLSSSGLSLLPWKQGYTYELCFYNCVPLTCEELEPVVFWVWSSPTQWHSFLVLDIILNPNNFTLEGLWDADRNTLLEISACCSLLLIDLVCFSSDRMKSLFMVLELTAVCH